MDNASRLYVDGRWGQIHLRFSRADAGKIPLLMLHQTPKSGWIWDPLFPFLAQRRSLIAPDTPGYGASDAPTDDASIEDYAAEMLALMDGLKALRIAPDEAFDVIGYHTGSVIATALAALAPKRVRRIVLVSLPLYSVTERAAKRASLPKVPALHADGSHLMAMWGVIDGFTDPRASIAWKQRSLVENLRSGDGLYRGYDAVYRYDLEAALPLIDQPILLINPQDDLWEQTHEAAALIRHGRVVELPNTGHGLFAVETQRIAELVADFLDGELSACR